jgi:hypothetical protein
MIRSIMGACVLILALAHAGLPASAGEPGSQSVKPASTIIAAYTGLRSAARVPATPWPVVPAAACTAECCCQFYDGSKMTNACKSRDDCINAGGICRSKTDAKCN